MQSIYRPYTVSLSGCTRVKAVVHAPLSSPPGSTSLGSASSIQAAVRQLEAEADAIIQMVREGQRARRLQQAPPPTASAAAAAAVATSAVTGTSLAAPHAPAAAAAPLPGTVAAATVSMRRTDQQGRLLPTNCSLLARPRIEA